MIHLSPRGFTKTCVVCDGVHSDVAQCTTTAVCPPNEVSGMFPNNVRIFTCKIMFDKDKECLQKTSGFLKFCLIKKSLEDEDYL